MIKTIKNLTHRVVILRFNSGQTLYLGPRKTSGEVPGVELRNNKMIEKLRERGVVSLHSVSDTKPAAGKKKPGFTKKSKKRKTQIKSKGGV